MRKGLAQLSNHVLARCIVYDEEADPERVDNAGLAERTMRQAFSGNIAQHTSTGLDFLSNGGAWCVPTPSGDTKIPATSLDFKICKGDVKLLWSGGFQIYSRDRKG